MKEPNENIKHHKHAKLTKPFGGSWHRIELGFMGAPCGVIQTLCRQIATELSNQKIAYIDADHNPSTEKEETFYASYIDKQGFHRFDSDSTNRVVNQSVFNSCDTVFVNGNHFKTSSQVLILNNKKLESLQRKVDRMNDVRLIVFDEGVSEVFEFLNEHVEDLASIAKIPITDIAAISKVVQQIINSHLPPLKGLLFAGGKSQRMGMDKGEINYHGTSQRNHVAKLLDKFCETTYLSVRPEQTIDTDKTLFPDLFSGLGPFGGLLTAFRNYPNAAFLSLPIDAPLIDEELLGHLVKHRNPNKLATCFYNPETKFPEPLITIWEPRAYPVLLHWLSQGYACPRKVLINSDIELLKIEETDKLKNANTQEERDELFERIKK